MTNEKTKNDAWLDELIEWADKNKIPRKQFPRGKKAILNLTELNLKYFEFRRTLPESIGNLTNLTSLDLRNNKLWKLPESIGNLTNLTKLDLSSNQLSTLPESIGKLTNLMKLNLNGNQLSTLPEWIGDLTNLTELSLSSNKLSTLPESIGNLTNLEELYLSWNVLRRKNDLPKSIQNLIDKNELDCFADNEDEDEDNCEGREVTLVKRNYETKVYFYRATVTLESGDEDLDGEELWYKYNCNDFADLTREKITDDSNEYDIED